MAQLLIIYNDVGKLEAEIAWTAVGDPEGLSRKSRNLLFDKRCLMKRVKLLEFNIGLMIDDEEMAVLKQECTAFLQKSRTDSELEWSLKYMPPGFTFNNEALINRSNKLIPIDIQIGLSFGWKFLFPYVTTVDNLHIVLAQLEHCMKETIDPGSHHEVFLEVARVLRSRKHATLDSNVQWLRFLAQRIDAFLKNNKDIFATRSDKGAHTVVLDANDYDNALNAMLNDGNYEQINDNPLMKLIHLERKFVNIFKKNHRVNPFARGLYEPATLILPKFYGLPKIHKETFCLRPITAMNMSPGYFTGKVFNHMINMVFPQTGHHIKDSYDAKGQIDEIVLNDDEVLVSYDVVSMYTNIPRELAKDILMSGADRFYRAFGIGRRILEGIIDFLLYKCTIFTALGKTYKQLNGLPMGGSISTNLARLVMDAIINRTLQLTNEISFVKVFVDDTIAVIKSGSHDNVKGILNSIFPGITFTCELEKNNSINFLNLTLNRKFRDGKWVIVTNWFRKLYASGRLLPYYSSHKRTTVIETAIAFIKTVITLSDGEFFESNRARVVETLRLNSFPETLIITLMNDHYTYMRARQVKLRDPETIFSVYPHAICESRKIKRILHKFKEPKVVYADSTRNSKVNFITTRKTRTPLGKRGNLIVNSRCVCGNKSLVQMPKFNETGDMSVGRLTTDFDQCENGLHAFKNFKFIKGLAYRGQTRILANYIGWKHRKRVGFVTNGLGLPAHRFTSLIPN